MKNGKRYKLEVGSSGSIRNGQEIKQSSFGWDKNHPEYPKYQSSPIDREKMSWSEERQLMLRLEELAQIEGLREDKTRIKIPFFAF